MGAKRNLTNDDRAAVLQQLLARLLDHKHLPRGAFVDVAAHFGVDRSTVRRIWKRAGVDLSNATRPCNSVASRKKGHCGRNLKHNDVAAQLQQVPKARRTTFRSIAAAMDMPRSTLHEYYRRGIFVKYTSHIKPQLSDANKAVRVKWSMDFVHSVNTTDFVFDSMMDYVNVDEKWFFATRVKKTYYLAPNEEPPHRTCKSKYFITKVMFLSAVARPRWDNEKSALFDGKIGTWHFTEQVPAIRASRNRPAGTLETKPVSVTRDVYRAMLIDHVIPAIKAKWPVGESRRIIIQQDNARPHVPPLDSRIVDACTSDGWMMELKYQPPNSPDLNVLDLGFFRAIQSLQEKNYSRNVDDIVAATDEAWKEVEPMTLNANFLTLQCCMHEVIRVAGNNNYKIPHMKKASLALKGMLPEVVAADVDVLNDGFALLRATDMAKKVDDLSAEVAEALDMCEFSSQMEKLAVDGELDEDIEGDLANLLGLLEH